MKHPKHFISEDSYLLSEWNWEKNNNISPYTVGTGSEKKVWWKCSSCGYEWQANPNSRSGAKKHGCPECGKRRAFLHRREKRILQVGSLASCYPSLLEEWDYTKNGLDPESIPPYIGEKVWWLCKECGHSWAAIVQSRTKNGTGCPICGKLKAKEIIKSNKLKKEGSLTRTHPEIAQEWDYDKNEISPDSISWHYSRKVHWICRKGHEYLSAPNRRVRLGVGCPICAKESGTSFPEQAIFYYINKVITSESRFLYNGIEIDIYIPSCHIGIEYDGKHYHNSPRAINREEKKNKELAKHGIRLIRIKESEECKVVGDTIYVVQ